MLSSIAFLGSELLQALVIVFLLFGVPIFVIAVLAITAGYIQHDADAFLEELEADARASEDPHDHDDAAVDESR